jgi:tetratricopeptide (TPR) repeat protein
MDSIHNILKQAHSLFSGNNFDDALFLYSQALKYEPKNKEYQLYCIFCDIGNENSKRAQSLFDFFTIAKKEDLQIAISSAFDIIEAYDGNHDKMMELLKEFSQETTQALDAIQYKDFEQLIAQRGSFRVAFEDIMFSTKVALSSKDEFFKFVNQLIDNNFKTTAQYYLDGFNEYFKYDKQMVDLYDKLGKTEIDINYKQ